jgi:hypothetical protein
VHPTVKRLRGLVAGIEGAWVRRWQDGDLWVGTKSGFAENLRALHQRISRHESGFRVASVAGHSSWIVEEDR